MPSGKAQTAWVGFGGKLNGSEFLRPVIHTEECTFGSFNDSTAVMSSKHDYAKVMQDIEEHIASLINEIDTENRCAFQDTLTHRGEVRTADERDRNDEASP